MLLQNNKKNIRFANCGCSFETVGDSIDFNINIEDIDLNCKSTWKLIGDGNTKGCFQLESRLGQSMAKKLKPENIEQLAALISIMRPGCLEAFRDNKSVSNHYIDKKNLVESIDYFHPSLETILKSTYGEMIYQEQAMQICQAVADFDLQEADMLRKAIGKKKPEEMAKIKSLFLAKAKTKNLMSESEIESVFGWIEKSQRYSFNKSHAVSYALNAYLSAYAKAHFTSQFFVSYLKFAKDKIDPLKEIYELINNCREMHIEVCKPNFLSLNKDFYLDTNNNIVFGLTNIKGVGDSVFNKLDELIKENNYDVKNMSYLDILFKILDKVNKTAAKAMISVGCFDYFKISRKKILFDYDIINNLTDKERTVANSVISSKNSLKDVMTAVLDKATTKRKINIQSLIKSLDKPAYSLEDTPTWIAETENQLLGISITCSKIDEYNLEYVNTDCRSINSNKFNSKNMVIGIEIKDINIIKTKRGSNPGQEMAFIKVCDNTGSLDIVVFPEEFKQFKHLFTIDTPAVMKLEKSKNGDSAILKKIWQL
jgi:DNA polymerase-3 subunit alpha